MHKLTLDLDVLASELDKTADPLQSIRANLEGLFKPPQTLDELVRYIDNVNTLKAATRNGTAGIQNGRMTDLVAMERQIAEFKFLILEDQIDYI